MYTGSYAVERKSEFPARLQGVYPVFLDEGALRWSSRRSWKNEWLPRKDGRYFDKLSFRSGFDPSDEYLLLDGTSTFSHGHLDGNTITRLTWKDRLWIFESDYIKNTPRYHNGVVVTREGVQEEPAPLATLDFAADFKTSGFSSSTSPDFNGADWTRSIVWKKGRWFFVLDGVKALREGSYRLEQRWRCPGEGALAGNRFTVKQSDAAFSILSADDAPRRVEYDPDAPNVRAYPYGEGKLAVEYARKDVKLPSDGVYMFASLLAVEDGAVLSPREFRRAGETTWFIKDGSGEDLVGLDAGLLADRGIAADCALFALNTETLTVMNATSFRSGGMVIDAPAPVHIQVDCRKPFGILAVPENAGGTYRFRGMTLSGGKVKKEGTDMVAELDPGSYAFTLTASLPDLRPLLVRYSGIACRVIPGAWPAPLADFGFGERKTIAAPDSITAFCPDGSVMMLADARGNISRFDGSAVTPVCRVESGQPVSVIHAADINGDGRNEILAGDENENVYCFSAEGKPLWNHKLTRYYGSNANVTSIATARPDNSGRTLVYVATQGWKLYAFEPDGAERWVGFSFYHPMTRVGYLDNGSNEKYIASGTRYETPINVFSAQTGKNLWYAWEEMGSEFISRTDYFGTHLTDMVFVDTDGDQKKEIVFGTKFNTVYAVNARDGARKWQANVGDEITALRLITDHASGETMLLVATEAGDLFKFDRTGRRLLAAGFGSTGIAGMEVISNPEKKRNDIVLALRDGRLLVCDDSGFLVRAAADTGTPLTGLMIFPGRDGERMVYAVSNRGIHAAGYYPYYLRKMRAD
jgi:outer membrane protein assembly factor BamB